MDSLKDTTERLKKSPKKKRKKQ